MKRWMFTLVLLSLVIGVAACSNSGGSGGGTESGLTAKNNTDSEQSSESGTSDEVIELRYPWWGNVDRHEKYNQMMDMFEAKYPNVKIIREPATWGDYWDKIATQTAGGNPPDILQWTTEGQVVEYIERDAVLPLDDFIADGTIDISDLDPNLVELGRYNGKLYMLSKGKAAYAIVYNKSLLERKGLPLPEYEMSWDEMVAYMREIKPKLGTNEHGREIYPMWIKPHNNLFLETWMRAKDKRLFNEERTGFGFEKEDLIELFEFYVQMQQEGITPPPQLVSELGDQDWEMGMLARQDIIMDFRPGNHLKRMDDHMEDDLGLIRVPSHDGRFGEVLTGAFIGISAHSKHPEMVAKLIDMWMNDLEFNKLYNNEHGIIINEKLLKEMEPEMHPQDVVTSQNMLDVAQSTEPQPHRVPGMAQIDDLMVKAREEIEYGVKSIEEAVDEVFAEVNRILGSQ